MKDIISLFVLLFLSVSLQAQSLQEDRSIGVTFSGLGQNLPDSHLIPIPRIGGDTTADWFMGLGHYSFGITYIRQLSNRFDLEVGIEYNRSRLRHITYNWYWQPGEPSSLHRDFSISFIRVPISVRYNFWQYFFLNSGVFLGVNPRAGTMRENMGDIGIILGVGARYDFQNIPIGIFLNPYLKRRAAYLMLETGFRMGVVYNF